MSGIFEELEMFDEGDKIVTRQAIAAATKRFNDNFAGFLRQASTKKEFESRLALVDTDIDNMVADVVTEYGGDAERIASAVKETVKTAFTPTTPPADDAPACENCGDHGCKGCTGDPEASKTASDERPEHLKAQDEIQLAEEHSQVNPWLKKQIQDEDQEDGGNLRNKEANIEESQPRAKQVPLAEKEGYGGDIDEKLEKAPSAVGKGVKDDDKKESSKTAFEYTFPEGQIEEEPVDPATEQLQAQFENWFNTQPFPDELRTTCLGDFDQAYNLAQQNNPNFDQMNPDAQLRALIESVFRIFVGGPEFEGNFPPTPNNNPILGKAAGAHTVKKKGDEFVVVEDGGEEVAGPFDDQEKAYARANELNDLENLEKEASLFDKEPSIADQEAKAQNDLYGTPNPNVKNITKDCQRCQGTGLIGDDWDECPDCGQNLDNPGKKDVGRPFPAKPAAMQKALALKEAAARGEKRNFFAKDEWVNEGDTVTEDGKKKKVEDIAQHNDEKVVELSDGSVADIDEVEVAGSKTAADVETGDKTEERESLPTGNEDANDGPSPKMDKTKWKPNATNPNGNLEPIKTEGENSPVPTRQMDIKQKPDYQQDTLENLEKYDNNVWEREQLPSADDNAGFEGTRNIDQPTKAAETFPDKGQANPVTREALAGNEKVAIFEDERNILEENVPEDYSPSREGIMSELADLKQRLIDGGTSPEEAEKEIKDLVMGMWRTEQSPEDLESIGIQQMRGPHHSEPTEEVEEPAIEEIEIEEGPEEIEEIIERGDDDDDRVEVIHDHDEDDDLDDLGFDDPEKLDEDEDEDLPFDEELSEEELDRLLEEEDKRYDDDEDLFL